MDEPTISTSFKEKTDEKTGDDSGAKDEIIAKLKGIRCTLITERSYMGRQYRPRV